MHFMNGRMITILLIFFSYVNCGCTYVIRVRSNSGGAFFVSFLPSFFNYLQVVVDDKVVDLAYQNSSNCATPDIVTDDTFLFLL